MELKSKYENGDFLVCKKVSEKNQKEGYEIGDVLKVTEVGYGSGRFYYITESKAAQSRKKYSVGLFNENDLVDLKTGLEMVRQEKEKSIEKYSKKIEEIEYRIRCIDDNNNK